MARELTCDGLGVTTLVVGPSTPLLILPQANQVSMALKYASGGTLEIFKVTSGSTTAANGISHGMGYPLGTSEVFNASGAPRFYLAATGATTLANLVVGLSPGY